MRGSGGEKWSIVRATRPIPKGDQCLISYVQPAELSAASSRQHLLQFDFQCPLRVTGWLDGPSPRHPDWDRPPSSSSIGSLDPSTAEEADALTKRLDEADMLTRELEEDTYGRVKEAFTRPARGITYAEVAREALASKWCTTRIECQR